MPQVVIIGAGLTGLSTAYHLENAGFFDYVLLERESTVGGLCRSVRQDGFTFDYTGHLLHISDPYVRQLVPQLTASQDWLCHNRNSWIYRNACWSKYPFQMNLRGMSTSVIAECIEGFVRRPHIKNPRSFYAWVLTHFGRGFADHFFVPYQEKIFCCDTKKLSHTWTGRFVPTTTLQDIIAGIIDKADAPIGYNAQFYYPRVGGIDYLVHRLVAHIVKPILTQHMVREIDLAGRTVLCTNGYRERFGVVINTMPLNCLLSCIRAPSTINFGTAVRRLRASNVLNINLGLCPGQTEQKHWVYTVDHDIPFYRAGFAHTFAPEMVPPDHRSLYVEYAYRGACPAGIERKIVRAAQRLFRFGASDICTYNVLRLNPAYVTYTFWRDDHVPMLLARLREYDIHTGGRYGAWQYASMQEALLDGRALAQQVLSGYGLSTSIASQKSREHIFRV